MQVIVLGYVTIMGVKNYSKFNGQASSTVTSHAKVNPLTQDSTNDIGNKTAHSAASAQNNAHSNEERKGQQQSGRRQFRILLNPRLRLVSLLSSFFIVSTFMIPLVFFIDLTANSFPIFELRLISMVLVQLYTLVFPLLLLRYLTNLKSAVLSWTRAVFSSCRKGFGVKRF